MLISATTVAPSWWRQRLRRLALAALPSIALIASRAACRNAVCLTFDDGPDPVGTPRVLEQLKAGGARATFFLVGRNAEAHPDLVRRIRDEGHEIGHHSWSHQMPGETGARALVDEVKRTRQFLEQIAGVRSNVFRPPHGKLTIPKLFHLWAMGQTVVLWAYDPGDVYLRNEADFLEWTGAHPPRPGDIILLHDWAPVLERGLPAFVDLVRQRGLGFVTVSELVSGRPDRRAGGAS